MHVQYNHQLRTYTATDDYGVVLSVYNPALHGTVEDFKRSALMEVAA